MKKSEIKKLDREKASTLFIQKIVRRGYLGAIRDTLELLSTGPTWPQPEEAHLQLHRWFSALDKPEQRLVRLLVEKTAYSAIFGVMNVLDGTAGTLIPDTNTHLLITLQVYSSFRELDLGIPTVSVILNDPKTPIVEFHDRFQWAVQELEESSEE